jgi:uncharacterized DUF497 family protein
MATWDMDKRLLNLRKHGVDLALCGVAFDSPLVTHELATTHRPDLA